MIEPTDGIADDVLAEFMDWWQARPDLTGANARYEYAAVLMAEVSRLRAERDQVQAAEPRYAVVTWDWREQPDQHALTAAIAYASRDAVHVAWPETGTDDYALVLSDRPLTPEATAEAVARATSTP